MSYEESLKKVASLIQKYESRRTKRASQTKKAEEPLQTWEEYDAGKHVNPKETEFSKEVDEMLAEAIPATPGEVDPPTEGGAQQEIEDAYKLNPEVSVAGEETEDSKVDEIRSPEGGEAAFEEKLSSLSDEELIKNIQTLAKQAYVAWVTQDPKAITTKQAGKYLSETQRAGVILATLAKQASLDADLLTGFFLGNSVLAAQEGLKKQGEDAAEAAAPAEDAGQAVDQSTELLETLAKADPQEIAQVLASDPQAQQAVAALGAQAADPQALQALIELFASIPAEEFEEVLNEDPELRSRIEALISALAATQQVAAPVNPDTPAQILAEATPEEIMEVLQENPELQALVEQLVQQASAADPQAQAAQILAEATPDEIAEVLEENPDIAQALGLTPESAPAEQPTEPATEAATEPATEPAEEKPEEGEENPSEEGEEKVSAFQRLATLSDVMQEMQLTPDDLAALAASGAREEEAVKVANAVREFRKKFENSKMSAKKNAKLREYCKQYLQELLS